MKTTSERLKEIMKERNLKQIDILSLCMPYCEKYNIRLGRNDISQYVSGKVKPKQDKLSILGMALDVNEVWLMGYDVDKKRSHDEFNEPKENTNNINNAIGNNLRQCRESKNISTEEMANEFNISVEDVRKYEKGLKEIPIQLLKMFATYFEVSIDELVSLNVANKKATFITKDMELSRRYKKWQEMVGYDFEFTDEEIDELISFAKYLISKRKDKK